MTGLPLTSWLRKSQTSYPSNLEVPQENLGSPTFFPAAAVCPFFSRTEVLNSVSHRIIMIYISLRCVLNISLLLIKIRSHLFGKPVLVCRTLEKASTLVQLRVRFKAQRKKKRKENTWEKTPKTCFLKNKLCWHYFAEMYLMKYLLGLKLINTSERVAYFKKIAGKRRRLVQQQTNKRQLSMSYQQQYVRSRRIASKTIAICLYLDLLCVFSALVNSAGKQGYEFRNRFSENFDEKYVFFSFEKLLLLSWQT